LGFGTLNEEQNRLVSLAVMCAAIARFDRSALDEQLERGGYRSSAAELIERFRLGSFIDERQSRGQFPFDKKTSRAMAEKYG
jgi:hypothetical protein